MDGKRVKSTLLCAHSVVDIGKVGAGAVDAEERVRAVDGEVNRRWE